MTVEFKVRKSAMKNFSLLMFFNESVLMTDAELEAFQSLLQPCTNADFVWRDER